MTQPKPAGRLTIYALAAIVLAGAALLGLGAWTLAGGDGDRTVQGVPPVPQASGEPSTATSADTEAGQEADTATTDTNPGGEAVDAVDDDDISRADRALTILVRGETPQGWTIESPDGYGFYPVGSAGPDTFTAIASSGFAQSPEGAGLAAVHILQRLNPLNPDWKQTADQQLVGPGAAAYKAAQEAAVAAQPDTVEELLEASAFKSAWVGWNVISFDPQAAELRLAGLGSIDNQQVSYTRDVRLEWLDGDWRLVSSAPNGSDLSAVARVVSHGQLDVDMRDAFAL